MKREPLYTYLCASVIALCLGLGSVGSMVSGLCLPADPEALAILCLLLAAVIPAISLIPHSGRIFLVVGIVFLLNPDFLDQLRTVAAAVALRLELAYSYPIPEFLQDTEAEQLLPAMGYLAGLIMIPTVWAVQKQQTAIPAALLAVMALTSCVTVTDSVPGSLWLFLWGLGMVLLLMPQGVRQISIRQGNRLTALLLIPSVLVLLLLFRLVPRNAMDRWPLAQLPQQILNYFSDPPAPQTGLTGSTSEVDLSALGKRLQNPTPVMDVTADYTGFLYLRKQDYDVYSGTGWHCTSGRIEELYGFSPDYHEKTGTVEINVRRALDYYFIPAITRQAYQISNGQLPNPEQETAYGFKHCILRDGWQTDWKDSWESAVNPRYLQLNRQTEEGALDYLVEHPQSEVYPNSTLTTAEWIGQLVGNQAPYSLSTPSMPADQQDLALWFLNDAPTGYCVHYATAAVVLLRASSIPARYVEGYTVYVEEGKTVTVRELDAHAWAEYYVNGVGWLILDATPSARNGSEEPTTTEGTVPEEPSTTAPTEGTAPTLSPTDPTQTSTVGNDPDQTVKPPPAWIKPLVMILTGALIAWAVLWLQYRLRRFLFRKVLRQSGPNRRALVIHRRLRRLSKWTAQPIPAQMTQLAQKARFSQHTLTPAELSQLQGYLRLTEAALSKLPLPKRLIAKWLFARY